MDNSQANNAKLVSISFMLLDLEIEYVGGTMSYMSMIW